MDSQLLGSLSRGMCAYSTLMTLSFWLCHWL